jgi:predicted TIM-barrel enzyme
MVSAAGKKIPVFASVPLIAGVAAEPSMSDSRQCLKELNSCSHLGIFSFDRQAISNVLVNLRLIAFNYTIKVVCDWWVF